MNHKNLYEMLCQISLIKHINVQTNIHIIYKYNITLKKGLTSIQKSEYYVYVTWKNNFTFEALRTVPWAQT